MADRQDVVAHAQHAARILVLGFVALTAVVFIGGLFVGGRIVHRAVTCDRTETTDGCRLTADRIARKACDRAGGGAHPWEIEVRVRILYYSSGDTSGVPETTIKTYWCEDF